MSMLFPRGIDYNTILLSLPWSRVWDVMKQNLLDKGTALNLDIVTAKLLYVYCYNLKTLGLVNEQNLV